MLEKEKAIKEVKEPEKWLKKAHKDLKTAMVNLENKEYEAAAFFSHQAAEKALKALFILKFKRLWKIHDLKVLGEKVNTPTEILEICDSLNPAYLGTRYPLELGYNKDKAGDALGNARRIVKWVKEKLKR